MKKSKFDLLPGFGENQFARRRFFRIFNS